MDQGSPGNLWSVLLQKDDLNFDFVYNYLLGADAKYSAVG